MMIYEVNLSISKEHYPRFLLWLKEHVKDILQLPGFIQASIFKQEETGEQEQLTVQYQLMDKKSLERYLIEFSPKMRAKGIEQFEDKFSATRRIFEVQDIFVGSCGEPGP